MHERRNFALVCPGLDRFGAAVAMLRPAPYNGAMRERGE
jgi:hypothetical protein